MSATTTINYADELLHLIFQGFRNGMNEKKAFQAAIFLFRCSWEGIDLDMVVAQAASKLQRTGDMLRAWWLKLKENPQG